MTEHRSVRTIICTVCDRPVLAGSRFYVDCSGATTRRYCRGCVPDARKENDNVH